MLVPWSSIKRIVYGETRHSTFLKVFIHAICSIWSFNLCTSVDNSESRKISDRNNKNWPDAVQEYEY